MTRPNVDLAAVAAELTLAAKTLREIGAQALRLAADWESPLSSGGGGLRPKNEISDPTGNRAVALASGRPALDEDGKPLKVDPNLQQQLLVAAVNAASTAATTLRWRLLVVMQDVTRENGRMGIGTCADCRKYCTGEKGNRLTVYKDSGEGVCASCRASRDRKQAVAGCTSEVTPTGHDSTRCQLTAGHGGSHRGGGWAWSGTSVERVA